jgi:hypothetical protein
MVDRRIFGGRKNLLPAGRRGRVLVLASVAIFSFAAIAAAQNLTARAGKPQSSPKVARFNLLGTNGFEVSVFATVEGPHSTVDVSTESLKGGAEYETEGLVTANRIRASFGQLGAISLRFYPSGRISHSHVFGDKSCPSGAKARLGDFQGVFHFRGENDYTSVDAHRISGGVGDPTAPIDHREETSLGCPQRLQLLGVLAKAQSRRRKARVGPASGQCPQGQADRCSLRHRPRSSKTKTALKPKAGRISSRPSVKNNLNEPRFLGPSFSPVSRPRILSSTRL